MRHKRVNSAPALQITLSVEEAVALEALVGNADCDDFVDELYGVLTSFIGESDDEEGDL